MTGIYKITNTINNKVYIGQSTDIAKRWSAHKNPKVEENTLLRKAFQKYGIEHFLFEIIEECSIEQLNEREIYWIQYYNSYGEQGYNMTYGGDSHITLDYEQIKTNYLETKSIHKTSEILHINRESVRKVLQYYNIEYKADISTPQKIIMINPYTLEEMHEFNSIVEGANYVGISEGAIRACLSGKHSVAGGYYWKKQNEQKNFIPLSQSLAIRPSTQPKTIIQLDNNNCIIAEYRSLSQANLAMGTSRSNQNIKQVCENQKEEAFGYKWKYKE